MFPPHLEAGYRAFLGERFVRERARYQVVADRQRPEVMVIGCCDSRVSPEVIFDARPGELFVMRNVANLVPPYSPDGLLHGVSAALEFAVQALEVKHIVVLGHARCGGIRAFAAGDAPLTPGDFIGRWMALIEPAAEGVGARGARPLAEYLAELEQASTVRTLGNLMTFPFVRRRVETQELQLHAAYFDVANGRLAVLDRATGTFATVASG